MAGLWVGQANGGVPLTWVWVVGVSPQILEHPTSICDTGVNPEMMRNSIFDLENGGLTYTGGRLIHE